MAQHPVAPTGGPGRHKLVALDFLRGLAACAVVLYHRAYRFPFPHGYLAVDFFFMLSGFVMALAYGKKLDGGWSTREFLLTRFARLYPLYFAGLVLGLLASLSSGPRLETGGPLAFLLNLCLLPDWANLHASAEAFPYNIPAWSLFFEIVANVLHALFLRRRSSRFLLAVVVLTACGLAWVCRGGSNNLGSLNGEVAAGLIRVMFAYVVGMLVYRLWASGRIRWSVSPVAVALLLLALLAGPMRHNAFEPAYDLIAVALFPLLLLAGATSVFPRRWARPAEEVGAASYAVYILHQPVLSFLNLHGLLLAGNGGTASHILASAVFVGVIFLIALAADRWYDAPARAWMRRRLLPAAGDRPIVPGGAKAG